MKKKIFTILLVAPLLIGSCGDASENAGGDEKETSAAESKTEKVEFRKISNANFKVSNMDKKYFKLTDEGEVELALNSDGGLEVSCEFEVVSTFTGTAKTIEMSTVTNGEMRTDDSDGSQFLDFMMGEPGSKATFTFTGSKNIKDSWETDAAATKEAVDQIESFKILTDR